MSHTTALKTVKIIDVHAIKQAVDELKARGIAVELVENATPRMYYPDQYGSCPYVLKLTKGRYDVGLALQEDGSYAPVFDEYNDYVRNHLGTKHDDSAAGHIGQFLQTYAKHAAINSAVNQGYVVEQVTTDEHGNMHIEVATF